METIGIIGGADGPAAILVAGSMPPWAWAAAAAIAVIVALAVYRLFRR